MGRRMNLGFTQKFPNFIEGERLRKKRGGLILS